MNRKGFLISGTIFSVIFFTFSGGALAEEECVCESRAKSLRESVDAASAVFVASVERFQKSALRPGFSEAQVRLMSRFKGLEEIKGNTLYVYTPDSPGKCGMKLIPGQDYIFYTEGRPARLIVTSCSRSGILDNALNDMEALGKLKAQAQGR